MSSSNASQPTHRIVINGFDALVEFDDESAIYCGRFVGMNGSATFYARQEGMLRKNATRSLAAFLRSCQLKGIPPRDPGMAPDAV
jgi:predicted HicB family RNase H-like nuclease